jgi:hypothetical protein
MIMIDHYRHSTKEMTKLASLCGEEYLPGLTVTKLLKAHHMCNRAQQKY